MTIVKNINWKQLEKNSESKEIGFEQFCFQIAYHEYSSLGNFDYWYNTPGSEFYLTLKKDSEALNLKAGDVVGWQAKFWLNNSAEENSPLDKNHRDELIKGLKTSLEYKPNLKKWIICTPGKFSNTAPHKCVDKFELGIKAIKADIQIDYWYKDVFLSFSIEDDIFYSLLFNHYFSTKFIGFNYIKEFSEKRLERLKEKFDIDLYVENEIDNHLSYMMDFEKVKAKIKLIINNAKRLIKNQYPRDKTKTTEYKYLDKDYARNLEKLIKSDCELVENINLILDDCCNSSILEELLLKKRQENSDVINALNNKIESNTYISNPSEKNEDYYSEKSFHESCIRFVNELSSFVYGSEENDKNNIKYYLKLYSQQSVHVFGSAGYGKTNLACAICKKHLDNGIPALLVLGSNIKDYSSPQEQMIANLDLKNEYSFKELLFGLNELGKLKQKRVPIIIDGLNESIPTAKIWKVALSDIIYDIKIFSNLLLITTLRDSYVHEVFGKTSFFEVENHYKIEGFNNYNIKDAITKYFAKYNISIRSKYNKNLFKNPLLLKMFCLANQNSVNAIITQSSIYKSIDNYISNLILKIADGDPVKKSNIIKSIESICIELWDNNARAILYLDKYLSLVKGNNEPFVGSIAHSLMDEGMFLQRNITDNNEEIQFTYDMVGGFCVAKYCLSKDKNENEIKDFIQSDEFMKLIPSYNNYHPLAEDIIKAILYFIPNRCDDKPLYKIVSNLPPITYIANLDILTQNVDNGDRSELVEFFSSLPLDESNINMLCEKIYIEVLEQNDFSNIDILYSCYFNWSNYQRDIYWNEKVRTNARKILQLLKIIIKEAYINSLTDSEQYNHLLFCITLFSSTDNEIRNFATKTAVNIGQVNPFQSLSILKKSINISDVYILERILGVLCGVVLRAKDRNFTIDICEYLQNEFLPHTKTNHIVILDYIETILEFGKIKFGYLYSTEIFDRNKNEIWTNDIEYERNVLSKRKYFDMGIDIFDYDFVKYQINFITRDENNKLNFFDVFSRLHYRIGLHGYKKEQYEGVEQKLSEEQKYKRVDDMDSQENYLFKYLWTSYYEFVGYLTLNDLIEKENQLIFRFDDIMIDPTFPQLPPKIQLVNDCFLPSYNEKIQDWINSDKNDYFENIYSTTLRDEGDEEWILLNAYSAQKDDKKYYNQIIISVEAFAFSSLKELKKIKSKDSWLHPNAGELNNVYSGELPWRNIIKKDEYYQENDENIILLSKKYSFISWSKVRSNLCNFFPFLNEQIALFLSLSFNSENLSFYSNKVKVTKYIWASGSHFYFIKKSYLKKYLLNNDLNIVHNKYITKCGNVGAPNEERTLNPSYKDIKDTKIFNF